MARRASATGPVEITVAVPEKVKAVYVVSDLGFGRGYHVTVKKDGDLRATKNSNAVRVVMTAPAKDPEIPVTVHMLSLSPKVLVSRGTASGSANEAVEWTGKIDTISLLDSLFQL